MKRVAGWISLASPLTLLVMITVLVFVSEMVSMTVVYYLRPFSSDLAETLLDSTFLIILLGPAFYFFMFRPMILNINERIEHERELQQASELLENRVLERTADLLLANELLQSEITAREKTEDALTRSYEFSKTILNSMQDAISIIDVNSYRIIEVNSAFLAENGRTREEVIGKTCHEVTHDRADICTGPLDICPMKELLDTGKHVSVEHLHFDRHHHRKIYVEVSVSPVLDASGAVTKVVHVQRDITERKSAEQHLRESEERFRSLFDTSLDGIYWTDREGLFTLINQAGAEIFGHASPLEMIGKSALTYWISPADRERFVEKLQRDKVVKSYPMHARRTDGTIFELEATSRMLVDAQGNFAGVHGILRDVTERKHNEDASKKNHAELQELFTRVQLVKKEWELSMDCTDNMIILSDAEGKIKRCNRAVKELTGLEYPDILQQDWADLLNAHDLINDRMTDAVYGQSIELYHQPSGRWFMLNSYPYEDMAFGIQGTVLTLNDFTELRNMTEALEITNRVAEENNRKLHEALEGLTGLIQRVTQHKDFSTRFSNPNMVVCHEVMNCGKPDCPAYGSDDRRCWQTAGTFCGGKVQGMFAQKYENCSECSVYKLATSDPVYQIGENFNNMMHILEIQHQELENAYNELKIAQSQITQQEKMASIGQLAAGVAHEINNPTGFIMSNLGSLQRYMIKIGEFLKTQDEMIQDLPEAARSGLALKRKALKVDFILEDVVNLVKESLDGAERIKKIVQDLKSFSRVDDSEQKLADINAGLESTINIVWNELKYKAVVKKEYGEIPQTKCNLGQLNQVFMNMLVNAAHAIDKQGEITIRTWEEDGYIYASVSDTGSGIPADKLNRIFEPFYTTKEVGKGTGLGLSIAYEIMKKHQGEIRVESEVGKGTTFTVKIPVVEA